MRKMSLVDVRPSTVRPAAAIFLYVVPDRTAASYLPAAAVQALIGGAHLLVVLARPRHGFTTDAAIARYVARGEQAELDQLERLAHQLLHRTGVSYDIVPMTYWGTRSPAKRQRRIAAAASRLARRRGATPLLAAVVPGATPLLAAVVPGAAQIWAPQIWAAGVTSSAEPGHVVAVLPDSAEAVRVARAAGELASASGRPLALVVPVPEAGFTLDPGTQGRAHARVAEDAAAVAGRVRPTLDALGLSARTLPAPYCTDGTALSVTHSMAAAIEDVARGLRAEAVVLSAGSPVLTQLRIPARLVHRVEPAQTQMRQSEADWILG